MDDTDKIRLKHMLEAAQETQGFAANQGRTALNSNRMLVLALVEDIEIIGEAASKVSQGCRDSYPQIPWNDIIGMRNYLIHAYFKVDLEQVWSTIQDDLPPLIAELKKILPAD